MLIYNFSCLRFCHLSQLLFAESKKKMANIWLLRNLYIWKKNLSPMHRNYAIQCEHTERLKYIARVVFRPYLRSVEARQQALPSRWFQIPQERVKTAAQSALTENFWDIYTDTFPPHNVNTVWLFQWKLWWLIRTFRTKCQVRKRKWAPSHITFILTIIHSHPQDVCLADLRIKRQKIYQYLGSCIFKLTQQGRRKEVRICA